MEYPGSAGTTSMVKGSRPDLGFKIALLTLSSDDPRFPTGRVDSRRGVELLRVMASWTFGKSILTMDAVSCPTKELCAE